jgi:dynein heavy chain
MVSYAGPFTAVFREALENLWREQLKKLGIKLTHKVTMRQVIGNDVTIRQWGVAGLPSDNLSIENGIIMFGSRRWPLMIDPQTQANKFVKNMGKALKDGVQCEVFKPSHPSLIRDLEYAVQFGKWVLLENVGEVLDPALEPVLLMQLTK